MKQNFPVRHFICYYIHVLKIQDPCSTVYSKVVFELFKLRNSRKTSVFKSTMTKKTSRAQDHDRVINGKLWNVTLKTPSLGVLTRANASQKTFNIIRTY